MNVSELINCVLNYDCNDLQFAISKDILLIDLKSFSINSYSWVARELFNHESMLSCFINPCNQLKECIFIGKYDITDKLMVAIVLFNR